MEGYLSLNEISRRASMSTRFIRQHLSEIPHFRLSDKAKIWIRWTDFAAWMGRYRILPGENRGIWPTSDKRPH
jgi:hypothetical protein